MLVVGAKGHAKEILGVLNEIDCVNLKFFDNVSENLPSKLFDKFSIIRSDSEAASILSAEPLFILGIGGTHVRYSLYLKMIKYGGEVKSVIASSAVLGEYNVILGEGINIMHKVFVSNDVTIGKGVLLNTGCSVHHDVCIGDFCEICPGAIITGGAHIGAYTSIGTGAIVLPKLKIGNNVTVGAGAVVTHDIADNSIAVGVPARILNKLSI